VTARATDDPFIARVLHLGEGELGRAARLVALIFSLSAALVMIKSAQSGIFLMAYPKTMIPWAFFASAITLSCASLATVPLASRLGAARLLRVTLIACATALLGARALLATHLPAAPFVLYVVVEAVAGVVLIHGWGVVSQATTARSAKRLLPIAGAGATLAWTFVGLLVVPLAHVFGAPALLLFAGGVFLAMVPLVMSIRARDLAAHVTARRRTGTLAEWKKALAYLRAVPLLRVMATLSILALVTEQFMDYALMTAAHERYATEASCAGFFGRYYGITSAITLLFLLLLSGRVMLALGTSRTLLLTPITTIGAAIAAAVAPTFVTAVVLRAVDRVLKQSIWGSASEQTQTPLPPIERVQSRALVRGVIAPAAYACTAAVLAFMPHVSARSLAVATLVGVLVMVVVCTRGVKRAYRDALRRAIDERTLDLDEVEPESFDAETRATLLAELRSSDDRRAGLAAELLCEGSQPPDDAVLDVAVKSPSAIVRAAALRAIARHRRGRFADEVTVVLQHDTDATCRAEAARVVAQLGVAPEETRAALSRMSVKGGPVESAPAKVALRVLENEGDVADILAAFDDEAAGVVLDVLVTPEAASHANQEALHRELRRVLRRGPDSARLSAVSAAARLHASELLPDVVRLLPTNLGPEIAMRLVEWGEEALAYIQDQVNSASAESVRHVASALSVEAGEAAGPLLHRLLVHPDAEVRDRAVRSMSYAVSRGSLPRPASDEVGPMLSRELLLAYKMYAILAGLAQDDGIPDWKIDPPYDQLGTEIENEIGTVRERVLNLLALTGKEQLASAVQAGLRRRSPEVDAKIAELVDATLSRDLAVRIVPLFEHLSLRERAQAARQFADGVSQVERDPLSAIIELGDPAILGRAMLVYRERFRDRFPRIWEEHADLIPLFERMAFLRTVPIFEEMPGQELRRVAEMLTSVDVAPGEVIFKKGDPGDALYIVRRGAVSIRDGAIELSLAKTGDFFGELALLDNEPRSADAIVPEHEGAALARLHGADFRELMARRPQIQERILRVVVRRLRAASGRITKPS
jgi:hypothetical protein